MIRANDYDSMGNTANTVMELISNTIDSNLNFPKKMLLFVSVILLNIFMFYFLTVCVCVRLRHYRFVAVASNMKTCIASFLCMYTFMLSV